MANGPIPVGLSQLTVRGQLSYTVRRQWETALTETDDGEH